MATTLFRHGRRASACLLRPAFRTHTKRARVQTARLPAETYTNPRAQSIRHRPAHHVGFDSMPRFPSLSSAGGLLRMSDYAGTVVFAASGSITAGCVGMDVLGAAAIGTITAIGGGTFRDAVILHRQPFWIQECEYLFGAVAVAVATFMVWPFTPAGNAVKTGRGGEGRLFFWLDALGLGAFAVIGAMNACRMATHPGIAVLCGVVTATFGGVTRDVICGLDGRSDVPKAPLTSSVRIFHSNANLYAEVAMFSASCYMAARHFHAPAAVRIGVGIGAALGLRFAADKYALGLPTWDQPDFKVTAKVLSPRPAHDDGAPSSFGEATGVHLIP